MFQPTLMSCRESHRYLCCVIVTLAFGNHTALRVGHDALNATGLNVRPVRAPVDGS